MRKKNAYTELDIFDQQITGITPKDYCLYSQKMPGAINWQNAKLSRDSALYVVSNLLSVFNYRFRNVFETQSFSSWDSSVLLKQLENFPKFGVTNYFFTYQDFNVLCAFWTTVIKNDYGGEINSGGVFYLHGSENNENVSGFLMRLEDSEEYDFYYIPKTLGIDINYLDIEDYLDTFQLDIEQRLDK